MAKFPRFLTLPIAAVMIVSACSGGATPAPTTGASAGRRAAGVDRRPPVPSPAAPVRHRRHRSRSPRCGAAASRTLPEGPRRLQGGRPASPPPTSAQRTDYATVLQTQDHRAAPRRTCAIMPGIGFLRPLRPLRRDQEDQRPGHRSRRPSSRTTRRASSTSARSTASSTRSWSSSTARAPSGTGPTSCPPPASTPPASWDAFKAALDTLADKGDTTPLGLGAKDDWTLTDWFEEIYLRQNGTDAYNKLFSPDGDWTDPTRHDGRSTR